jgi:hypothetical protein
MEFKVPVRGKSKDTRNEVISVYRRPIKNRPSLSRIMSFNLVLKNRFSLKQGDKLAISIDKDEDIFIIFNPTLNIPCYDIHNGGSGALCVTNHDLIETILGAGTTEACSKFTLFRVEDYQNNEVYKLIKL